MPYTCSTRNHTFQQDGKHLTSSEVCARLNALTTSLRRVRATAAKLQGADIEADINRRAILACESANRWLHSEVDRWKAAENRANGWAWVWFCGFVITGGLLLTVNAGWL